MISQLLKCLPKFIKEWGNYGSEVNQFNRPIGIAVDKFNNLYISDPENQRIQKFNSDGTFIKTWGSLGKQANRVNRPMHLTVSPSGKLYVAEYSNDRVQVFDLEGNSLFILGNKGQENGMLLLVLVISPINFMMK